MGVNRGVVAVVLVLVMVNLGMVIVNGDDKEIVVVKTVKGKKVCTQGWECKESAFCCNQTISDVFQVYQFEDLFPNRNSPVAKAGGFWDYQSFIIASVLYQPLGFGTTGGKLMQMKEIAAFLAHVGAKTSCKHFGFI